MLVLVSVLYIYNATFIVWSQWKWREVGNHNVNSFITSHRKSDDYAGVGLQITKSIKHVTVKFLNISYLLPEALEIWTILTQSLISTLKFTA